MGRLRIVVALVVTVVWATGCVTALLFNPDAAGIVTVITPVMLAVVGWLFAQELLVRRKNGNGNGHA